MVRHESNGRLGQQVRHLRDLLQVLIEDAHACGIEFVWTLDDHLAVRIQSGSPFFLTSLIWVFLSQSQRMEALGRISHICLFEVDLDLPALRPAFQVAGVVNDPDNLAA